MDFDVTPSAKPWILLTAPAALGNRERVQALSRHFDLIIVPVEYFDQAIDVLDHLKQEPENGQQDEVLQTTDGPSND